MSGVSRGSNQDKHGDGNQHGLPHQQSEHRDVEPRSYCPVVYESGGSANSEVQREQRRLVSVSG